MYYTEEIGGTYHINSCEPIEVFYNARIDLERLQYIAHITKIVEDITNENDTSYNVLQLLLNTIYTISETEMDKELVISIFKMRLMSLIGFTPEIRECVSCKTKENITHFSIKNSGLKCENCAKLDKSVIKISEATLYAIKYAIMAPAKKLFSFNTSEESIEELKLIAKLYLDDKLEKTYKLEKFI
ncbi:MAG: DNA repair protein RecO [Clostridia bacterium]|nr:DNA repair protein RecO [Clostridia bacterium]